MQPPKTIIDLVHLEAVFDVLDLYLWLSYRFLDLFKDAALVRDMQKELDAIIQQGVVQITRLLRNSESGTADAPDEDEFVINNKKQNYLRGNDIGESFFFSNFKVLDSKSSDIGKGRLTERLLAQGILTPNMLQELKKEWDRQLEKSDSDPEDGPRRGGGRRRRWK